MLHRLHRAFRAACSSSSFDIDADANADARVDAGTTADGADPVPVMLFAEFVRALDYSETSILARRIFEMFDVHGVNALLFVQFALGVAILASAVRTRFETVFKLTSTVYHYLVSFFV